MMKYCRKQSKTVARKPTKKRQLSLKLSAAFLFFLCVCSRLSSASFVYLCSALGGQRRFAIYRMRICERSMYGFCFVCQRSRLAVKSSSASSRKKEKEKNQHRTSCRWQICCSRKVSVKMRNWAQPQPPTTQRQRNCLVLVSAIEQHQQHQRATKKKTVHVRRYGNMKNVS